MILITSFGVYRYNEKETFQAQDDPLSGHQWRMTLMGLRHTKCQNNDTGCIRSKQDQAYKTRGGQYKTE